LEEALEALEVELSAEDVAALELAIPAGRRRRGSLPRAADERARQRANLTLLDM